MDDQPKDELLAEVKRIAWSESIWHVLAVFSLAVNVLIAGGLGFVEWKTETRLRSLEAQLGDYQAEKWKVQEGFLLSKTAWNRSRNQEETLIEIKKELVQIDAKLRAK